MTYFYTTIKYQISRSFGDSSDSDSTPKHEQTHTNTLSYLQLDLQLVSVDSGSDSSRPTQCHCCRRPPLSPTIPVPLARGQFVADDCRMCLVALHSTGLREWGWLKQERQTGEKLTLICINFFCADREGRLWRWIAILTRHLNWLNS